MCRDSYSEFVLNHNNIAFKDGNLLLSDTKTKIFDIFSLGNIERVI